jgi:hypothetical protein
MGSRISAEAGIGGNDGITIQYMLSPRYQLQSSYNTIQ